MLLTKKMYFVLVTYWYTVGNFRNVILGNIYQLPRQGRGWVCELYPKIYNNYILYYIFWTYEGVVGCAFSVTDICYLESTCAILSLLLGVKSNIIYFLWYFAELRFFLFFLIFRQNPLKPTDFSLCFSSFKEKN